MTEDEQLELLDAARAGEKQPFVELFNSPDGVTKFLTVRDEYTQATPLHMAAANGHSELLKYFLEQIDAERRKDAANAVNDSGNTALHWCALTGSLDATKLLVEAGADPLLKNKAGIDSCYQADTADQTEVANYLYSVASIDVIEDEDVVVSVGNPDESETVEEA